MNAPIDRYRSLARPLLPPRPEPDKTASGGGAQPNRTAAQFSELKTRQAAVDSPMYRRRGSLPELRHPQPKAASPVLAGEKLDLFPARGQDAAPLRRSRSEPVLNASPLDGRLPTEAQLAAHAALWGSRSAATHMPAPEIPPKVHPRPGPAYRDPGMYGPFRQQAPASPTVPDLPRRHSAPAATQGVHSQPAAAVAVAAAAVPQSRGGRFKAAFMDLAKELWDEMRGNNGRTRGANEGSGQAGNHSQTASPWN